MDGRAAERLATGTRTNAVGRRGTIFIDERVRQEAL
jgi:hypothetical protein